MRRPCPEQRREQREHRQHAEGEVHATPVRHHAHQRHARHVAEQVQRENRDRHARASLGRMQDIDELGVHRTGAHHEQQARDRDRRPDQRRLLREHHRDDERHGERGGDGAHPEVCGRIGPAPAVAPPATGHRSCDARDHDDRAEGGATDRAPDALHLLQVERRPVAETSEARGLGGVAQRAASPPTVAPCGQQRLERGRCMRRHGVILHAAAWRIAQHVDEHGQHESGAAGDEKGVAPSPVLAHRAADDESHRGTDRDGGVEHAHHATAKVRPELVRQQRWCNAGVGRLAEARHGTHQEKRPEAGGPRPCRGEHAPERDGDGEHVQAIHTIGKQAEDRRRHRVDQDERRVEPPALRVVESQTAFRRGLLKHRKQTADHEAIRVVQQVQSAQDSEGEPRLASDGTVRHGCATVRSCHRSRPEGDLHESLEQTRGRRTVGEALELHLGLPHEHGGSVDHARPS